MPRQTQRPRRNNVALVKQAWSREQIEKLLLHGFSPRAIADALSVPLATVIDIVPDTPLFEASDDDLRTGLRVLAWRAIETALEVFNEGTYREKTNLARALVTPAFYALNKSETENKEIAELRAKLTVLLEGFADASGLTGSPVDDTAEEGRGA